MRTQPRTSPLCVCRILVIATLVAVLGMAGCASQSNPPQLGVTTTSSQLASVVVNSVYPGATLTAANGTAPYTWAVTSGALPTGLSLSPAGVLSGTPTQSGAFTFTVTVTDSAGHTATASLTVTVNQAPAITSANSTTLAAGTAGSFTVTATGYPAPTFSETGALPNGVTLNATSGALSGTPAAGTGGTYPIVITAHNGIGTNATQNFTLTVNQAPAITSVNNAAFAVGTLGSFAVTATGFPAVTLSETGALPGGVTFNTATGALSGTPAAGSAGTYPITFGALNGITPNASQAFTLTVDQAPAITTGTSTTFTTGAAGTFTVVATGFPPPTFTETGALPSGVILSAAGVLSGTPAAASGGTYPITITAQNGTTPNATQSFTLTVDQAPAFTSVNNATFTVGVSGSFAVAATGFPGPTFSETGALPTGVTLNPTTGTLSGTPATGTQNTYPITITAQNGVGTAATQTFTLSVDLAPAFTSLNNTTFTVGSAGSFTATATGFPLPTFSETGALPNGVTLTAAGALAGTPAAGTGGSYPITITAQNGASPNATQSFTLTVDQPPAITSLNHATFTIGSVGTFTVAATGFPAPTFSETGALPTGVTLNSTTGILSGTAASGSLTSYPITITAQNGVGTAATQTFTLTVDQVPAITSLNNATFTVGTLGTFTVTASGFPAPTFSETGTLPNGVTLNTTTGVLTGTPAASTGGTYPITVSAANGVGSAATQSFTLTVDQAPAITSVNTTTFAVGSASSFTVTATGYPNPTFSETGSLPSGVTLNPTSGALSGTAATGTQSGSPYVITITAQNGVGTAATQTFTLNVSFTAPPSFTSANNATFQVGTVGTFTVIASGSPAPTFSVTSGSLPNGVTLSPTTGVLSGTPAAATGGSYPVTITAQNGISPNATQSFTLTVDQAPAITSANTTNFVVGSLQTFTVTTSGFPASTFGETGALPTGVTLNPATGALSGTPATGTQGSYPITITAQNGISPNATQSFTLNVDLAPSITSLNNTTFTAGTVGSFTVTATGFPAPTFGETGTLPSGVTLNPTTGVLSGTPGAATGAAYAITITASNGVGSTANQSFTLTVDQAPAITSANSTTFTVGTLGTFDATATGFPVPTFSETGALPSGVTLSTGGVLTGTPATGSQGSYPITVTAQNGVGTAATQSFTLTVSAVSCTTNCTLSGTITGPWVSDVTITLTGGVQTTTDSNGNYSFTGLAAGGYTVTPSLTGYTYSPSAPSVTLSSATTVQNFTASSVLTAYSISGTISYSGSKTGRTIIRVLPSGCSSCSVVAGTSLLSAPASSGTAYTVRGLPATNGGGGPSGYVVYAEIGLGENESDSAGNSGTVTISTADVTGVNFSISDRTPSTAQTPSQFNVAPGNGTAVVQYQDPTDNNGEEIATSYKVYYGTDTNASNGAHSPVSFPAQGSNTNVFIVSGLTNGLTYFKLSAVNSQGESAATTPVSATIGTTTGANVLSGTVTFPGTATGPMYVGVYGNNGIFFDVIASPVSPQAYSVSGVTAGSYQNFAIIDQNNNGEINAGDLTNVLTNATPIINVSGTTAAGTIALANPLAIPSVTTNTQGSSGQPNSYSLSENVAPGSAIPTSMTLFSGPNVAVPYDTNADTNNTNYAPVFNSSTSPHVGDTYQFLLTFANGSSSILSAQVTGVITSFPQNLTMITTGSGSPTVPELSWSAPAAPPTSYSYFVGLYGSNGVNENWNYSGGHNSNGISSTTTSVVFDVDSSASPSSTLTTGDTYNWYVGVQDANGNSGQETTSYTVSSSGGGGSAPNISQNPTNQTVANGGTATFTANATGYTSVQWQVSTNSGSSYSNATGTGATSTTYSFIASSSQNGYLYQAVFTNGTGSTTTTAATLTVGSSSTVPTTQIGPPSAPPLQAGGAARNFAISVANDVTGDLPTITSFTLNGTACTPSTCGSFGAITGAAGSGSYTMQYTPPTSLTAEIAPTVTVSPSSSAPWFAGTQTFQVYPSGVVVTFSVAGGLNVVQAGSTAKTITVTVYNDTLNSGVGEGVTIAPLTASGYACASLSPNSCGTLGTPSVSTTGTTTTTTVTYTPPGAVPSEPYDRPIFEATSVADTTKFVDPVFLISPVALATPLSIPYAQKFDSALTGGGSVTVAANFADNTAAKSADWAIMANGTACPASTCGTLGTPVVTSNGNVVTSTVTYTPPASVPTGSGQSTPTITATMAANSSATDSFVLNIVDGTCGTGNNAALNGSYAFMLRGGSASAGYFATVGSFTADGNGNITGGLQDRNTSVGVLADLTLTGGSYSVGSDNRGCLTVTNSNGGTGIFRIALGTMSGSIATQGTITQFSDTTGQGPRASGILKLQNLSSVTSTTVNGTYAFGREGVDSSGHRVAVAGLFTSNGAGSLSGITGDLDDDGSTENFSAGSGSYALATNAQNGRGTTQTTIDAVTANYVAYVISSSDLFVMSTDLLSLNHPILLGETKLQSGSFSTTALTGGYVFYVSGLDNSNGGSTTTLGQSQFTTSGNATVTVDENDNGISQAEESGAATFAVASNGRMTGTGSGLGSHPPIIYLVDSTQGFVVGSDSTVASGYVQQQTVSSVSNSTLTGHYFFGGGAPTDGGSYDSGAAVFTPGTPSGSIAGTDDEIGPNDSVGCSQGCGGGGLQPNQSISGNGGSSYSFGSSAILGQGSVGNNTLAYIISPSKFVFMETGTAQNTSAPESFVVQQ